MLTPVGLEPEYVHSGVSWIDSLTLYPLRHEGTYHLVTEQKNKRFIPYTCVWRVNRTDDLQSQKSRFIMILIISYNVSFIGDVNLHCDHH